MKNWLVSLAMASLLVVPTVGHADGGAAVGALGGALLGGLSGPHKNRLENSLIGAAAGGVLGYAVDNSRERQSRVTTYPPYAETRTTYYTPQPTQNRTCREVKVNAYVEGRRETLTGLKCLDEYGQWQMQSTTTAPVQTVVVERPSSSYVVVDQAPSYYPVPIPVPAYGYNGRGRHGGHHRSHDWGSRY